MPNAHVVGRLQGIRRQLNAAYDASSPMSASSKGREREMFVDLFLKNVFPPVYRFGTGDVTDSAGHKSGQLDVVIEYPFGPSLPSVGSQDVRLYLAETAAAVIEVKSDLAGQWQEVRRTAEQLATIKREFAAMITVGGGAPRNDVPLIAVGYKGWSKIETLRQHVESTPGVAALLTLDTGLFVTRNEYGGWEATQEGALWALICFTHLQLNSLLSASTDPLRYFR